MKKRRIANLVMVLAILILAAAGILWVGSVQGWFDQNDGTSAVLSAVRGVVTLERDGVAFDVSADTVLRSDDRITCDSTASVEISVGDSTVTLCDGAALQVTASTDFTVKHGLALVNAAKTITLTFDDKTLTFTDAAAMLSVRSGAQTLSVLDGTVAEVEAGQKLEWIDDSETAGELSLESLNTDAISWIRGLNDTKTLCFTNEELDELEDQRQEEREALLASGDCVSAEDDEADSICTVTIRCDTILVNWDRLDPAKAGYVPEDGIILNPTMVAFTEGETAFDVLRRVCERMEIPLEYSWTPVYDSYYVEGIQHLYEFDCGARSGWMYEVNGWFPNYGCSSYTLSDGDSVVWCYTCIGLGADVGGSV